MSVSPARAAAFDILLRVESTDAYASELLHSSLAAKLSSADHGLATEIVMGVLRWQSVLDKKIAGHSKQPLAKLDREVLTAQRIGAYQLLFLDRIPAHAAINESVELVKKARKRSAAGMVNAVLRKMKPGISAAIPLSSPGRDLSQAKDGAQPSDLLVAASEDPPADTWNDSASAAHPPWLLKRWEAHYGLGAALKICDYDQRAPRTIIRGDAYLIEELIHERIQLEPAPLLKDAHVVIRGDITSTTAFHERRLVIQDEGSQLIALLLGHGNRILDCCAAPGGKTRIMAERNPQATVLAMELHPHRAGLLKRLVPPDNVHVICADARTMAFAKGFDRILVDAPCTGTGTLARNPEIKWRLTAKDITRLQTYQVEILCAAMTKVAPGGQVLFCTCSLEPEENEAAVERALNGKRGFRVLEIADRLQELHAEGALIRNDIDSLIDGPYLRTIPGIHPCDGFFAALLERQL